MIHPIFLPHSGCPFRCVYCNQESVVARTLGESERSSTLESFHGQLQDLLERVRPCTEAGEIAIYGGTFTALAPSILLDILDTLKACVEQGCFSGIRFSTRPDALSERMVEVLRDYPIRTVELGVQSLCDEVLERSQRGYDHAQVVDSGVKVREAGWRLGIQLMVGLPGDGFDAFKRTVSRTLAMRPDFVRIYPTLVLPGTRLADWFAEGAYTPLSLDEALDQCVWAYDAFLRSSIPVARMGLHADPELLRPGNIVAGPFHPAFGYLVRVRWWRNRVDERVRRESPQTTGRRLTVHAPHRFISEVLGPGRANLDHWRTTWGLGEVVVSGEKDWPAERLVCVFD